MSLKVNPQAVAQALRLVEEGKYALNSVWTANAPSEAQMTEFRRAHGDEALYEWFLARDEKDQPVLPFGDFRRVHRSGVVAAKRYAEKSGDQGVIDAAESILDLFDRMNAC